MRLGKNQLKALKFVHKYKGWHTYHRDASTIKLVKSLVKKKLVEDVHGQFRITKLGNAYIWDKTNEFFM